jgi:hypothetical protein
VVGKGREGKRNNYIKIEKRRARVNDRSGRVEQGKNIIYKSYL